MTTPKPRKRDAQASKARILAAAQTVFARTSYADAGIREIAASAGVSTTLLLQYYGSKAGLYEEALNALVPLSEFLLQPREKFGKTLAAALLSSGEKIHATLMIPLAGGDGEAGEIAARVMEARAIAPLAAWLGPPNARARALEIASMATGLVTYTAYLPLRAHTRKDLTHMSNWFARTVQAIVDGEA